MKKALVILEICRDFWKVESLTGRSFFFEDLLLAANRKGLKTNAGNCFSLYHPRAASSLLKAAYDKLEQAGIEDRWKLLEVQGKGGFLWRK